MRVNLSVAIVAMVNDTSSHFSNESHRVLACPELMPYKPQTLDATFKGEKYNWDSKVQGVILGSFFYGYFITQLPGGILAEKYGAKWLFGGGILVTAIFSLLTPLAADLGTPVFIAVRVLEGFGEGVTFPAICATISRWSPIVERSRISTFIFIGAQIGNVISMPVSGLLCSTDLLGGLALCLLCVRTMELHSYEYRGVVTVALSAGELRLVFVLEHHCLRDTIQSSWHFERRTPLHFKNEEEKPKDKPSIPWKAIFTSLPMWALIVTHAGHNFGFLILLTELPTYLNGILHFDITSNGLLSGLPYVAQAIFSLIASYIMDKIRENGKLHITTIRKISNSIGLFGPAICLPVHHHIGLSALSHRRPLDPRHGSQRIHPLRFQRHTRGFEP
ncbi:hypothetical protein CEXT_98891 [Caerostris extrusa]|uniref:Major facilitator superfamily (MFS) profile domain-containing protein n=1 Tax=Caerostris extrusa TaxID=172846 RepID=A0AAV4XD68_CAEEX|nr:hypothetical protein CEXT_98891 [Caerostris extrusa]